MKCKISLIIPCFGRPLRTRRIINDVLKQDINGWEAFVIGDGCEEFEKLLLTGESSTYINLAKEKGNNLVINNEPHHGGFGYNIYQKYKHLSTSPFIIFAGNDDTLLPNHFSNYLSEIENTQYDMVYYNSFIKPYGVIRNSELRNSGVGHSEIIVKRDSILEYQHTPKYDDDWGLIEYLINKGSYIKKSSTQEYTYIINRIGNTTSDLILD
jgi:glycosyltransferase involved in cell wall biosynthesis